MMRGGVLWAALAALAGAGWAAVVEVPPTPGMAIPPPPSSPPPLLRFAPPAAVSVVLRSSRCPLGGAAAVLAACAGMRTEPATRHLLCEVLVALPAPDEGCTRALRRHVAAQSDDWLLLRVVAAAAGASMLEVVEGLAQSAAGDVLVAVDGAAASLRPGFLVKTVGVLAANPTLVSVSAAVAVNDTAHPLDMHWSWARQIASVLPAAFCFRRQALAWMALPRGGLPTSPFGVQPPYSAHPVADALLPLALARLWTHVALVDELVVVDVLQRPSPYEPFAGILAADLARPVRSCPCLARPDAEPATVVDEALPGMRLEDMRRDPGPPDARRPIRLALMNRGLPLGGVETRMYRFCQRLPAHGFEIEVMFHQPGNEADFTMVPMFRELGIPVHNVGPILSQAGVNVTRFQAFVRHLRTFDVAHVFFGGGPSPVDAQAAFVAGVPVVLSPSWSVPAIDPLVFSIAVGTPRLVAQQTLPNRRDLIPFGVDFEGRFNPHTAAPAIAVEPGSGGFVVGRVSRLVKEKSPAMFVQAAALLKDKYPHNVWLVVGDGPERAGLEELAGALGVNITFAGSQTDVAPFLRSMDLFAYAPRGESVGNVLFEALAMEVPVICKDVGGVRFAIRHNETGWLLGTSAGAQELADAIDAALGDMDRSRAWGRAGRRFVQDLHSMEDEALRLAALFREAAQSKEAYAARAPREARIHWAPTIMDIVAFDAARTTATGVERVPMDPDAVKTRAD